MAEYFVRFSTESVRVYDGYASPPFDLALFDQGIWLLSRFHAPFVTVMGRDLFGDHTCFIVLVLVPFYWVWPHVQLLLILQTAILVGAAIPIYLVALKYLRSGVLATVMAATYLLNPALENGNLEQFHPEAFLVLGIALAIYAALEWKPKLLVGAVIVCLLTKQDSGMMIMPLGLWIAWRRNLRFGLAVFAAAAAWQVIAFEAIIYAFLGTTSFQANRIPFGGLGGVFRTFFFHFGKFWDYAKSQGRLFYLWQMGLSAGWTFLIAPEIAAICVLDVTENLLSTFPYQHQILYHYSMPAVPVLVLGTVWAISRQKSDLGRRIFAGSTLACAFSACVVWGLQPFSIPKIDTGLSTNSAEVADISSVERRLPPNAVVSAWYPYVAHIDHRTRVYMWPTPFYATDWGLYNNPGARLPFASQIQYILIPSGGGGSPEVFASISNDYSLVAQAGDVMLYEIKASASGARPAGSIRAP